ncbi:hypothetical protein BGW80DRAFT_683256 [Lactifluus volemus]|nr:hypothetical protein BGW80DRAFT_683256 [Lactifluus volemus]
MTLISGGSVFEWIQSHAMITSRWPRVVIGMPPLLQRERPNMTGACASERSAPSGRWREKGRSCWAQHKADTLNARVAHVQHRSRRMTQNTTHHVSSVKLGAWGPRRHTDPKYRSCTAQQRNAQGTGLAKSHIGLNPETGQRVHVRARALLSLLLLLLLLFLPEFPVVLHLISFSPRSPLATRTHARCGPRSANESSFFCATHYTHLFDKRQSFGFQLDASFTRKKKKIWGVSFFFTPQPPPLPP